MRAFLLLTALLLASMAARADVEYPRILLLDGHQLRIHHPVIDRWDDFQTVEGWIPVEVRLAGQEKMYVGSVRARAATRIDLEKGQVAVGGQTILGMNFRDADVPEQVRELARRAISSRDQVVSLDVLLAELADDFEPPAQARQAPELSFSPPRIVVVTRPTQLLLIDKEPVTAPISGTEIEFVVNTDWRLFYHPMDREWIVLNDGVWQKNSLLASGGWNTTDELPEDFRTLAIGDRWPRVTDAYPATMPAQEPEPFLVSMEPTELISIDGEPRLAPLGGDGLEYVTNTGSPLFRAGNRWYFMAAGRWFSATTLDDKWRPVDELPGVFASIPADHALGSVRRAVPGTMESMMAMLEASLPHEKRVRSDAGASLRVGYVGAPEFVPIPYTQLARAANSPFTIIRHNNYFYLCYEAAWYFSRRPEGPWEVALDVPEEIYSIPASDPAHYVTYVFPPSHHPEKARQDEVVFTYNNGYMGDYSTGKVVVQGTGWYYDPWLWNSPAGYPVYWGHPWTYGWHGAYWGRYGHPFHYYGGYWSQQQITIESPIYGGRNDADPAFQDPRLARRGYDYSTLQDQRVQDGLQQFNAADDLYTDNQGNVYRRSDDGGWSQHTESGWNTMAELERQYGAAHRNQVGQAQYQPEQRQAYQQNERDIERMERYYRQRQKAYNFHSAIYVGR